MNLEEIIKAKIELQTSIRNFVVDAVEKFEEKTGITPSAINIHMGHEESIGRTQYPRILHCVLGVEAIITI